MKNQKMCRGVGLAAGPAGHKKNRFENRSGESGKTTKNKETNGGNDFSVVSQDAWLEGPALHQVVFIEVKHVAKVPNLISVTKL